MKKIAQKDDTKYLILSNEPIEEKLHSSSNASIDSEHQIHFTDAYGNPI
jgi:hypothetical protein